MLFRRAVLQSAMCGLVLGFAVTAPAQEQTISPPAPRPAVVRASPIPEPPAQLPPLSREQRQQAYAKLLEGHRHLWAIQQNLRSQSGMSTNGRLARAALQKAVELNPGLAEAYTALAELAFFTQNNTAEVERLANISVKLDKNNFGSHRLLAWIYTRQSNAFTGNIDKAKAEQAIKEWGEIARLDPRSAEAWAFLSDLYDLTNQTDKQIEALERWSSSATPLDDRFYRFITQKESLSPASATAPLGRALIKAGKYSDATAVLIRAVSVNPDDNEAIAALEEAVKNGTPKDAERATEVLQQAVYANPNNVSLLELLTDTQVRAGRIDSAATTLRTAAERLNVANDKATAANVLARLGSVYAEAGRNDEAIAVYEQALKTLNIGTTPLVTETERSFAGTILPRMATLYRNAGQTAKARETIARLGTLLGNQDSSADEQLVELLRSTGDREAALQAVKEARKRFPEEQKLLQLEANVLTDLGRVDEGVDLLRSKIINKTKEISVPQAVVNDFLSHLNISTLYVQAGRGAEAAASAQLALDLAQTSQMTTIAMVTLATAQNASGDFKSAESSLREVLKSEPNNATALNNLGYFMVERGERLTEAVDLIKRAVEREPNNASFLDSLGWAHFKLGQLNEAEKYLTEASRRNPNSVAIHHHLGDLYERQGKTEQAKTAWRKALNMAKEKVQIEKIKAKLGNKK